MKEEDCGEEAQARLCLVLAAGHTLPFYKLFNLDMLYLQLFCLCEEKIV